VGFILAPLCGGRGVLSLRLQVILPGCGSKSLPLSPRCGSKAVFSCGCESFRRGSCKAFFAAAADYAV